MIKANVKNKPTKFLKMHGLGNDFLIIDSRSSALKLTPKLVVGLADRSFGVGFDQLGVIFETKNPNAEASVEFWNADGTMSATCGNATRCIARILMDEKKTSAINLVSNHRVLECIKLRNKNITVNMGAALFNWQDIPLSEPCNTLHLPIEGDPVGTSIGNPHCTFFVNSINDLSIETIGKRYETDSLFPAKTNVQIAEVLNKKLIKVRVWERGVGLTKASGSAACAVASASFRRNLTHKKVKIILDGGELDVDISEDGIWMSGPTCHVFDGTLTNEFLANLERN